jgi:outer membrane receptor protein involved in Fe transport
MRGALCGVALVVVLTPLPAGRVAQAAPDTDDQDPGRAPAAPAADETDAVELGNEVVEIWDERPKKPFDRDTQLRLTGADLITRGAADLADALDMLPEINVRAQGRGGWQADIRGARKSAVKVLVDGMPVDDPFYGNFDLSSIPVTDIEQIRVSTSPSSPIDGPGGPGGVVEVHTRDAVGARMLRAQGRGAVLDGGDLSVTGRTHLGGRWAVRGSAAGSLGDRDFQVSMPDGRRAALSEQRRSATGALRFEYRRGDHRRLVADVAAQHRTFVPPPGDDGGADILVIEGETAVRGAAAGDLDSRGWRVQARGYGQHLARDSVYFADASLGERRRAEHLAGNRAGLALLVNRPHSAHLHLVASATVDTEGARVEDERHVVVGSGRATVSEAAGGVQFERGRWRIDVAAGVAAPIGVGESAWPEAKAAVYYQPARPLTLSFVAARKGRLPSLRERYRTDIGNPDLDPELVSFGEVGVEVRPAAWLIARVSTYVRDTDGMIRFDGARMALINIDDLLVRGFDTSVDGSIPRSALQMGGSWSFQRATSPHFGGDPLDFLPAHRASAWLGAGLSRRGAARVRIRRQSEQLDRSFVLGARTELDLSAHTRFGERWRATVRVDNLTDERYELRHAVEAAGRVITIGVQGDW